MILSGCSNNQIEPQKPLHVIEQHYSKELLSIDCEEIAAGETPRSLAKSWVNNTGCLRAYKALVDGLIERHNSEVLGNGRSRDTK